MRRWLTIALGGLVLSCQGPAAVMAEEAPRPGGMEHPGVAADIRANALT